MLAAVAALAGCGDGGGPHLARADAAPLIALSHRIAAEGVCAQSRDIPRFRDRTLALVRAHRVPPALAEPLVSGMNALVAQMHACLPTVTTTAVRLPPPAPHGHQDHHGHHGHGHGGEGD